MFYWDASVGDCTNSMPVRSSIDDGISGIFQNHVDVITTSGWRNRVEINSFLRFFLITTSFLKESKILSSAMIFIVIVIQVALSFAIV